MSEYQDAVAAAKGLTGSLDGVRSELKRLNEYGKRNRHLVWLALVSIVLDVTLTVLLVFVYGQARNSGVEAQAAKHSNTALCLSSNKARAQQVELWDYLISLSGPPRTVKGRHLIGLFQKRLTVIFAPRNCSHINPGRP